MRSVSTEEVRQRLIGRQEIALLDVRVEAEFAAAHPLFAASVPLGRLELEILDRVPRPATPVVVYDDGEGLAWQAIQRLGELGYSDVTCLHGGLSGWRAAGAELFRDVNVPSKAFGELVEACSHTPSLTAEDLRAKLDGAADLVILDARRFEEYRTMSIPTATSVPGAELVYRVRDLAARPETLVVVNCAGRTRSIIGTQSLVNAGIPNRVVAPQPRIPAATTLTAPLANAYKRPYEGTANPRATMQSYLDWEFELVAQLERDGTHHFRVI